MAGSGQLTVGTLLASAPAGLRPGPAGWFSLANGTAAAVYLGGGTGVTSSNGAALATGPRPP
jgi:hypothetical protein